ncbi:hypothetical protein [Endozoicomonas montiporae]|uniref:hypothetical protein n=1 Tax=Endozoicomonas montiporae TaxID=1027273 RepID=UPI00055001D5|nr:hypothetical protein [Endozoicomonas montiporae]
MKSGTDRESGALLEGIAYLKQRLSDVINTELGSLVGDRDFGSRLHELVDHNIDATFHMDAFIRLAEAINNPVNGLEDFGLKDMRIERQKANWWIIDVTGTLLENGEEVELDGIIFDGGN